MNKTKPTKKELFLRSYASNFGHITNSCIKIKINRASYYDWIKTDESFKKAIIDIDKSFIDLAESALRINIGTGMQKAIEFYLCNKKKDTYSNTIKNQLSGADGGPISITLNEITYKEPEKPTKKNIGESETLAT